MLGLQQIRRARDRRGASGFTLVELLTVVAIVGVLASVCIVLVRRHLRDSKSLEAVSIIAAIRAAQEAQRAETGSYLNVSRTSQWYPAAPDGKTKRAFTMADGAHVDAARWKQLGVSRTDGTQFGFRTYAGPPGPINVQLNTIGTVTLPDATDDWFVIEAGGNLTQSSAALSLWVASSLNGELYVENEGE